MKLFILTATSLLISFPTFAAGPGFKVGLSTQKADIEKEGATVGTSETTMSMYDVKIGIITASNIYFGGIYHTRVDEVGGSKTERTALGGTLGYHSGGWFLDGSYFANSTIEVGSTKIEEGTGYAIDFGYNVDILSSVFLGMQVSYKSFTYNKVNGAEIPNTIKSDLNPMLNIGVVF